MGDMGDMYRDWKADKKEKAQAREERNMKIIREWIISESKPRHHVHNYRGTVGFRLPGKPKVDFYPTKNKWRKGSVIYYGNTKKFLEWYEKQCVVNMNLRKNNNERLF